MQKSVSATKSRSDTASRLFCETRLNLNSLASFSLSMGYADPASAPEPRWHYVYPFKRVSEALFVALKHFKISHYVMGEKDRLGLLHVRVARHDDRDIFFGDTYQAFLEN